MDKAFVISLHSQKEQFEEVRRSFDPYGISCERFSAIEQQHGFVGCALSHLQLIALAKKNDWPWIMVFEDDCVPREAMKEWPAIKFFLKEEACSWDLFLGGCMGAIPQEIRKIESTGLVIIECRRAIAAHFAIYNKTSYDHLLAWHDLPMAPEKRPAFDLFINKCSLRKWVPLPGIAWQKPHDSTILKRFVNYDAFFEASEAMLDFFKKTTLNLKT